jgi:hypothetical protein
MYAWHFVGETLRDGSPAPRNGRKLVFKGEPILCSQGLHASIDPFDALQYAPGPVLCRVWCSGVIIPASDKLVCTQRTIVARMDATEMLRYFARTQALSVVHLYPNSTDDVVFDYLMTGSENLQAAANAATVHAAWAAMTNAAARVSAANAANAATANAAATWAARAAATWAANAATVNAAANAATARAAATWAATRADFNALVNKCFGLWPKLSP